MIDDKLLKFHSDAIDFIYNEMKGKEYCDKLFLNDLLEKGIVLPGYKIPYNMIEKWYEAYNAIMRFLQYNKKEAEIHVIESNLNKLKKDLNDIEYIETYFNLNEDKILKYLKILSSEKKNDLKIVFEYIMKIKKELC